MCPHPSPDRHMTSCIRGSSAPTQLITISRTMLVFSRVVAFTSSRGRHSVFRQHVCHLLVELHGACLREPVPEDDANDRVWLVTDVPLVVTVHHQEQLLLGLSADDPLRSGTALVSLGLNASERNLQELILLSDTHHKIVDLLII